MGTVEGAARHKRSDTIPCSVWYALGIWTVRFVRLVIFRFHLAALQIAAYCVSFSSDTQEIAWPDIATGKRHFPAARQHTGKALLIGFVESEN
ncbi:hypothetical protein V1477_002659 [Vespula maculifrons]|uniref:Uncharacterized protein n=4 Tax=Vespula TaxID=7451 RepID=A0A834NUZ5_VESGE|nr:hypothetical protein HZH66_001003 [Vespula vulgaris]KAF7418437.1 hypothetical protein HZH68_001090 [Vespula germanica]KAF7438810.1 hypothetical protein H0235_001201 [Vespula pensylvanica]